MSNVLESGRKYQNISNISMSLTISIIYQIVVTAFSSNEHTFRFKQDMHKLYMIHIDSRFISGPGTKSFHLTKDCSRVILIYAGRFISFIGIRNSVQSHVLLVEQQKFPPPLILDFIGK